MATKAERTWNRNSTHTSITTDELLDQSSPTGSLWRDRSARIGRRSARSRRRSGSPACSACSFVFTAAMVASALVPERSTITPPTTSPSPSSSATPRRISGPSCTVRHVAEPDRRAVVADRHADRAKVVERTQVPRARTMYSASAQFQYRPAGLVVRRAHRLDHLVQRDGEGAHATRIDHDLILPVEAPDGGNLRDVRHALQLNFKNQSCSARSSRMSYFPLRSMSAYS